jgi:VWFA-related protein
MLGTALCLLLLTGSSAAAQPTFRAGIKIVPLYVTVTDAEKRLIPDLVADDFTIFEDGKPRKIELFQNESLPITVVVMLDTSGSMTLALDEVKAGAEQFLLRLLPADKGMVVHDERVHQRPRLARGIAQGTGFRLSDAALRRD